MSVRRPAVFAAVVLGTVACSADDPRIEAFRAFETVGAALQAHRADHARYPKTLEGLVPDYLDVLPTDPFSGDSLAYVRTNVGAAGLLLYSVGPDGIDDGGAPSDPVTRRGDLLYPVGSVPSAP